MTRALTRVLLVVGEGDHAARRAGRCVHTVLYRTPGGYVKLSRFLVTESDRYRMPPTMNTLYYGDNLDVLRRNVADESVP